MSIHDQLLIRPIRPEDAEEQYATVTDPRVTAGILRMPTMEITETREWIAQAKPGVHRLVAELNGRNIGSANLRQFQRPRMRHAGSIGIMLHPAVARTTLRSPSQEPDFVDARFKKAGPGIYRYVAVADEKVVGIGTLHQSQNPRARHSAGLGMMVHPDYWGMGIGTQLMEKLIDLADNWLNLVRVELEVNTDNPTAVHLYEKFGFVIEGTKKMHAYGDGRMADSHFMARIRE
ncbi:MAG TPA: GNAT family N-acetyltransferase [Chloroflexi bacterium]|nr:GNAT family N-acetyltransferase [Chloroflexota bacterium]